MGIKYFEKHLVLKYHGGIHRYIQIEMDFWTSCPWARPIDMPSKSSKRLNKKCGSLGLGTPHNKSRAVEALTHGAKDKAKMGNLMKTIPIHKQRRTMVRRTKIPGSGVTSIRAPGITLLIVAQISH
jgi:hypothetical protein